MSGVVVNTAGSGIAGSSFLEVARGKVGAGLLRELGARREKNGAIVGVFVCVCIYMCVRVCVCIYACTAGMMCGFRKRGRRG